MRCQLPKLPLVEFFVAGCLLGACNGVDVSGGTTAGPGQNMDDAGLADAGKRDAGAYVWSSSDFGGSWQCGLTGDVGYRNAADGGWIDEGASTLVVNVVFIPISDLVFQQDDAQGVFGHQSTWTVDPADGNATLGTESGYGPDDAGLCSRRKIQGAMQPDALDGGFLFDIEDDMFECDAGQLTGGVRSYGRLFGRN